MQLSQIVNSINAWKAKKSLEELSFEINHIEMDLTNLKTVLKSIRVIHRLSSLKLGIRVKDKNNLNMLKPFSHLASLSQLSVDLSKN